MKRLIIAAAIALAPAAAFADDWTVNGNVADQIKFTVNCSLNPDAAGALTGSCKMDQGDASPTTGQITGKSVAFSYDTTYQGSPVHLDYKGDLQDDGSLKGTIDVSHGTAAGTFTATKK